MDDSEYRQYDVEQACEFLGCKKEWLWDMCQQRKITHLKRNTRTFFLRRHLIEYIESLEVPAQK
jgi:hypothetical protein